MALATGLAAAGPAPAQPPPVASSVPAAAEPSMPVGIDIAPLSGNPASPAMGDHLTFRTIIRNTGSAPIEGVIGWISLVQTDRGREQPVDLEDWSAHKAITIAALAPGQAVATDWPMRLIQPGTYRVVVSAATRDGAALATSPFADFSVRAKPVVESARVLPVALGVPMLIGGLMVATWRRGRGA
jgi:hypothetical protein